MIGLAKSYSKKINEYADPIKKAINDVIDQISPLETAFKNINTDINKTVEDIKAMQIIEIDKNNSDDYDDDELNPFTGIIDIEYIEDLHGDYDEKMAKREETRKEYSLKGWGNCYNKFVSKEDKSRKFRKNKRSKRMAKKK